MKKFAPELAAFLRRFYPDVNADGYYRFSADIRIRNGQIDVEIPILTRLPDEGLRPAPQRKPTPSDLGMTLLDD